LVVDDLPTGALPEEQGLPVSVKQNGSYPANDLLRVEDATAANRPPGQKILSPSTSQRDER
jgi:hypothetical protein